MVVHMQYMQGEECACSLYPEHMAQVNAEFVSVGVTRVVNALDWGSNGLIAYGGHHIVCIYNPEVRLLPHYCCCC